MPGEAVGSPPLEAFKKSWPGTDLGVAMPTFYPGISQASGFCRLLPSAPFFLSLEAGWHRADPAAGGAWTGGDLWSSFPGRSCQPDFPKTCGSPGLRELQSRALHAPVLGSRHRLLPSALKLLQLGASGFPQQWGDARCTSPHGPWLQSHGWSEPRGWMVIWPCLGRARVCNLTPTFLPAIKPSGELMSYRAHPLISQAKPFIASLGGWLIRSQVAPGSTCRPSHPTRLGSLVSAQAFVPGGAQGQRGGISFIQAH